MSKRLTDAQIARADAETIARAREGADQERGELKVYAIALSARADALIAQERAAAAIEGHDPAVIAAAIGLTPGEASLVGGDL